MTDICFYFQVHQPFRLRPDFDFFSIGRGIPYEDDAKNGEILRKVAERCYLPANALLLELIKKHEGRFKVSFSISGTALEQFERYEPRVIDSFRALVDTGAVEILSETYYHSLAFLYSRKEFKRQVKLHAQAVKRLFGVDPTAFRNTELIYNDELAKEVEAMGYKAILTEGADRVLDWRSPGYVYRPTGTQKIGLLLKHYRLSDDVAFRFSAQSWSEWPLTAEKYADWIAEAGTKGPLVNLFMDYETFGEHQWAETGIFEFLRVLPGELLRRGCRFVTPTEAVRLHQPVSELSVPGTISWADSERDLSAWLENHMQQNAMRAAFSLEKAALATKDAELMHAWAKLTTSDHFYYMSTKYWADGDVHKYFSPYDSPYDAFVYFSNALNELRWRLKQAAESKRAAARRPAKVAGATPLTVVTDGGRPRTLN